MPLVLTRDNVISLLDMNECITAVEKAFAELSNGTAVLPLRINITPAGGLSLYMPAYLKEMKALVCKVVTVYKHNPVKYNLPVTIGKLLLQDPGSGEVLCIMDAGYLTAVRTGAASGTASKYLARDEKDMTAGVFGAGAQAVQQLHAVCAVRDIKRAYVYDTSHDAVKQFAKNDFGCEVIKSASVDEALNTDIICLATSSAVPLFDGAKVKPGTHINGIGSHTPGARELDSAIIKRSKLVGDSKAACFSEAGDIMIPLKEGVIDESHFYAELGDVVTGKIPGRTSDDEITLFKSNGLAIQDAAAAKIVYDKAIERKAGRLVEM